MNLQKVPIKSRESRRQMAAVALGLLFVAVGMPALGFAHAMVTLIVLYVVIDPASNHRDPPQTMLLTACMAFFGFGGLLAPALAIWLTVKPRLIASAEFPTVFPLSYLGLRWELGWAVLTAFAATLFAVRLLLVEAVWRYRQLRRVRMLATSKVRSVALGAAELRGRAVAAEPGHPPASPIPLEKPFYLEDETGRIKIDPRGAALRAGWFAHLGNRTAELVLEPNANSDLRILMPGDPLFVIGDVQSDGDELVIKPTEAPHPLRALFLQPKAAGDLLWYRRDSRDVFLITNTSERGALRLATRGIIGAALAVAVYLATGAYLFVQNYERFAGGFRYWSTEEVYRHAGGAERISELTRRLANGDPAEKIRVLGFLSTVAYLGDQEATMRIGPHIAARLGDASRAVRERAVEALEERPFRSTDALESLPPEIAIAGYPPPERRRLSGYRPDAQVLIKLLGHEDATLRRYAARVLAHFPERKRVVIPALIKALGDADPGVAEAARFSLQRLTVDGTDVQQE